MEFLAQYIYRRRNTTCAVSQGIGKGATGDAYEHRCHENHLPPGRSLRCEAIGGTTTRFGTYG